MWTLVRCHSFTSHPKSQFAFAVAHNMSILLYVMKYYLTVILLAICTEFLSNSARTLCIPYLYGKNVYLNSSSFFMHIFQNAHVVGWREQAMCNVDKGAKHSLEKKKNRHEDRVQMQYASSHYLVKACIGHFYGIMNIMWCTLWFFFSVG